MPIRSAGLRAQQHHQRADALALRLRPSPFALPAHVISQHFPQPGIPICGCALHHLLQFFFNRREHQFHRLLERHGLFPFIGFTQPEAEDVRI